MKTIMETLHQTTDYGRVDESTGQYFFSANEFGDLYVLKSRCKFFEYVRVYDSHCKQDCPNFIGANWNGKYVICKKCKMVKKDFNI